MSVATICPSSFFKSRVSLQYPATETTVSAFHTDIDRIIDLGHVSFVMFNLSSAFGAVDRGVYCQFLTVNLSCTVSHLTCSSPTCQVANFSFRWRLISSLHFGMLSTTGMRAGTHEVNFAHLRFIPSNSSI